MVGRQVLALEIGVRVPVPEHLLAFLKKKRIIKLEIESLDLQIGIFGILEEIIK